jgi:surface antigen
MVIKRIACITLTLAFVSGCADMQGVGQKQGFGTLGGAALGGLAGSQIGGGAGKLAATAAGTLLGAFLGNSIGSSLDKADQMHMAQAQQQAFEAPIDQPVQWQNPQSSNYGTITPTRQGYSASGLPCREFRQQVYIGGRKREAYGTACRQADGSWQITG